MEKLYTQNLVIYEIIQKTKVINLLPLHRINTKYFSCHRFEQSVKIPLYLVDYSASVDLFDYLMLLKDIILYICYLIITSRFIVVYYNYIYYMLGVLHNL